MPPAATPEGETPAPLLRISGLEVSYGRVPQPVVHGVDLTVRTGHRVAIVGESGSGKSTTAAAAIGLLPGTGRVTGGTIEFDGEDVTAAGERRLRQLRGRQIGLVPQDPMSNLNPVARVGRQIAETLVTHGLARGRAARERAVELMTEAGIPDAARRARQYPHEFSGGMRQRVLIAIALACEPQLLIADEPTSALDVTVQRQILDHLERLTDARGTSMLLITHDLGLAAERADDVVVMWQGRVVETGRAAQILRDPQHEYTRRLVAAAPSVATRSRAAPAPPPAADPVPALEVTDLVKTYKVRGQREPLRAVDRVSFTVREGTTTAIVGESGSGKSTVARMVLDLLDPTSGRVLFDGIDVRGLKGKEQLRLRRQMQPIFQNPYASLDPLYSIYQSIEEPLHTHDIGTKKEREARVRDLLDKVSLPTTVMTRYPGELSGGQRQRVAIARALALDPEVVICDEAVSALDVLVQAQILTLLNDLQAELGLSYLFITHDLAVVRQIADNVLVMQEGRVVEAASVTQVFDDPQEDYTKKLLDAIPGASIQLGV